jgi:hypothetical protein
MAAHSNCTHAHTPAARAICRAHRGDLTWTHVEGVGEYRANANGWQFILENCGINEWKLRMRHRLMRGGLHEARFQSMYEAKAFVREHVTGNVRMMDVA